MDDDDDITFDDLLDDEPASTGPASYAQLLTDGFPSGGGLAELTAIAALPDPGRQLSALQRGFQQILEKQREKQREMPRDRRA